MKRALYRALGRLGYPLRLHRTLLGERAVVAVFHRIDDALPNDPITVRADEFRDYCAFFRRHFDVVPVSAVVDRLRTGQSLRGRLAITFDDGYLDNHSIGAPVLEELGLPAGFFICTGFIGTEAPAPWDARAGIRSRWMSWDQVRDLARRGFEIGAHTMTHPDLGRVAADQARREVVGSRERLERELGRPVELFCYPFGGAHQLNAANRQVIRESGLSCCFSCFGGTVRPGDDPFTLRRAPISPWHRSPEQYGFELLWATVRRDPAYA